MKVYILDCTYNFSGRHPFYPCYMPNYYLYSFASIARREKWYVRLFESPFDVDISLLIKADVLLILADEISYSNVYFLVEKVRKASPVPIIIGNRGRRFLGFVGRFSNVYLMLGDGERTFPQLLNFFKKKDRGKIEGIRGIVYRRGDDIVRTKEEKVLTDRDLELLPFPSYEEVEEGKYDVLPLETSRGISFFAPYYPQRGKGWRSISPLGIFQRSQRILNHYIHKTQRKAIFVIDEIFTAKEKRIFDLSSLCKKHKITLPLVYRCRPSDILHGGLVKCLSPITHRIFIRGDCGYNQGLIRVNKAITTQTLKDAAEVLLNHGLADKSVFTFYIGFPWEKKEECLRTITFAENLKSLGVGVWVSWFFPLPHSLWWEAMEEVHREALAEAVKGQKPYPLGCISQSLSEEDVFLLQDKMNSVQGFTFC